jgi:hypothetical protein
MGKWITTALLCAASMIGSALIASQGFGPDPIPEDTATVAECASLTDDHARQDCIELSDQ